MLIFIDISDTLSFHFNALRVLTTLVVYVYSLLTLQLNCGPFATRTQFFVSLLEVLLKKAVEVQQLKKLLEKTHISNS